MAISSFVFQLSLTERIFYSDFSKSSRDDKREEGKEGKDYYSLETLQKRSIVV